MHREKMAQILFEVLCVLEIYYEGKKESRTKNFFLTKNTQNPVHINLRQYYKMK